MKSGGSSDTKLCGGVASSEREREGEREREREFGGHRILNCVVVQQAVRERERERERVRGSSDTKLCGGVAISEREREREFGGPSIQVNSGQCMLVPLWQANCTTTQRRHKAERGGVYR